MRRVRVPNALRSGGVVIANDFARSIKMRKIDDAAKGAALYIPRIGFEFRSDLRRRFAPPGRG